MEHVPSLESLSLSKAHWVDVANLWKRLAHQPIHDPEFCLDLVFEHIATRFDCHHFGLIVAYKSYPGEDSPMRGWRPAQVHNITSSTTQSTSVDQWSKDIENLSKDISTTTLITYEGKHRTLLREDIMGDAPWSDAVCYESFMFFGTEDRLVSGLPITPMVEVYLLFDRSGDVAPFDHHARDYIHAVVSGLVPYGRRFAISFGLYDGLTPLTPRERQVLLFLLEHYSEKEIAALLGLTRQTVHQYVVSIYRKFQVNSRPEIVALWLEGFEP